MADSVNDEAARLIAAASRRDGEAAARLLLLVYEELRKLAHCRLAQEPPGSALQTTELVHEAYLRLFEDQPAGWSGTGHSNAFSAIVSTSPRSLRKREAEHHGDDGQNPGDGSLSVGHGGASFR